jgi:hypothetical protein
MLSLCQIDAAVRRVGYYNPDLELELLFLDEAELDEDIVGNLAHIRSALVARVADIGEAIDSIQVPGSLMNLQLQSNKPPLNRRRWTLQYPRSSSSSAATTAMATGLDEAISMLFKPSDFLPVFRSDLIPLLICSSTLSNGSVPKVAVTARFKATQLHTRTLSLFE